MLGIPERICVNPVAPFNCKLKSLPIIGLTYSVLRIGKEQFVLSSDLGEEEDTL